MAESPIRQYLRTLRRDVAARDTTEESHYPTLKDLIEALGTGLRATPVPKRGNFGAPDFHVKKRGLPIGHIEAKDLGANLDDAEGDEQIKDRYRPSLINLILTNFLEFRWYVRGEHRKTVALGHLDSQGKIRSTAQGEEEVVALLKNFLGHKPQGALKAKELALSLARLAQQIRDVIIAAFQLGEASATLRELMDAMQKALLPDLTPEQFADMFAQTLVYGFFTAWCNHPLGQPFTRDGAARDIPKGNPFLRQLFETITGTALDEEPFVGFVEDLILLLHHTDRHGIMQDFGQRTGREDPTIHFYETFLKEYDPKLRELRGVYYTPDAVVSYMVRSVDHLLRTRFDCPVGLADASCRAGVTTPAAPRVLILDPACGTGGFLSAIIAHIHDELIKERRAGEWPSYVRENLLPRIFGFELLMAPYAVAHLRLGLQLSGADLEAAPDWADELSGGRLGVFLTNSLEEAVGKVQTILGLRALADEANAAADVKRTKLIMVVIGNPPYSGHSANRSWRQVEVVGKKPGSRKTRRERTFIGRLLQDYYQVDGKPLGEKNPKWLQDDYVKFIRFGQWRIEQTGEGILALITNHSYLDNPTFRGMRQQLMQAFTDIYLLDLHGNARKRERAPDGGKDENVFDIEQGVAIALFVKERGAPGPARLWHADLWGLRESKEAVLAGASVRDVSWRQLQPASSRYLFVPQDSALAEEYERGWSVAEMFPVSSVGVVTARDDFAVAFAESELGTRVSGFGDSTKPEEEVRRTYLKPRDGLDVAAARAALLAVHWEEQRELPEEQRAIQPMLYRPFDERRVLYHDSVVERSRRQVMRHMLAGPNLAMIATRQTRDRFDCLATRRIVTHKCMAAYDINTLFPLYLYPAAGRALTPEGQHRGAAEELPARQANLSPAFVAALECRVALRFLPDGSGDLKESFGPEDVFAYIYAILHCPTYRGRYAEFLKRDFPRIPLTSERDLFAALAEKGRELVALHLMESPLLRDLATTFPEKGADTVERVWYDRDKQRVYINKAQYFDGVPRQVWDFFVGGYQVCEKWLKDRKGRKLDNNDLQHYQRIVVALRETNRLMREIDTLIASWPLA
jgi:predicted helicase